MYYIALLASVLVFMTVIASLDASRRRQSPIDRGQRD
jgi:hypothetical protein